MSYKLPSPSAEDRGVAFTVPKEIDPLYIAWYQDSKKTGETVNQFILRQLNHRLLEYIHNKELLIINKNNKDARLVERLALESVLKTNLGG